MAVRFKFRSSLNFDSVDLEGRSSITVRDLKSKIAHKKHLDACQDLDLIFSDSITGQDLVTAVNTDFAEYNDENFQIPSGSSVIIKRVPAGLVQLDRARVGVFADDEAVGTNMVKTTLPAVYNVEIDNFDDFGDDLCPIPKATTYGFSPDIDEKIPLINQKTSVEYTRNPELPLAGCEKLEVSDISEAIPRVNEETTKEKEAVNGYGGNEKVIISSPQVVENTNLPSELKCSLCDTFFKEAVMIPCCQHSFCQRCICQVLVEKGRCPKCFSTKYRVEHLLPNVSLRQAIDRFLESQILAKGSEDALNEYAPDGESAIHPNEISVAVTTHQRDVQVPYSPSATGRGSNQFVVAVGKGKSVIDFNGGNDDLVDDFQGENKPMFHEVKSAINDKGALKDKTGGVERSFVETARHKNRDRSCYMCGSPNHLIRDCPAASCPHPMLQTGTTSFMRTMPGYLSPFWNQTSFPQIRPFMNPYGNTIMTPYNAAMAPATPFTQPYMSSMYGGMAGYGGFTRMGGSANAVDGISGWRQGQHQDAPDKQLIFSNENQRGLYMDPDEYVDYGRRHYHNESTQPHDPKSHRYKDESASHSGSSFGRRPSRKHRHHHNLDDDPETSSSEEENIPRSCKKSEALRKHRTHCRNSEKHGGSPKSPHQNDKESHVKRERHSSHGIPDRHNHKSLSDSDPLPSSLSDRKIQRSGKESSRGSRHSRQNSRSLNNEQSNERWQMVGGTDDDMEEEYYRKRKRVY